jgi:UDP-glucose 4-epimerase
MTHPGIRRLVLLGHSGFLGQEIHRQFREQAPSIELQGLSTSFADLRESTQASRIKDCLDDHTALLVCSGMKKQLGDSLDLYEQNLKIAFNLCRILKERRVPRVVFLSTASVYGEDIANTAIDERTPVQTRTYYGLSKYCSELLFSQTLSGHTPNPLLTVRAPLIYGAGDRTKGYGPSGFVWAAHGDRRITLWGDGRERREFLYVKDFARAVCALTFLDHAGVVNVVTGQSHTFEEAVTCVGRLVKAPLRIDTRERTKAQVDQAYDNGLLRRILPDFTFTPLEQGIRETFDSVGAIIGGAGHAALPRL